MFKKKSFEIHYNVEGRSNEFRMQIMGIGAKSDCDAITRFDSNHIK